MRGAFLLGLNREVRRHARTEAGDTVDVELTFDTAPRDVEVPQALAAALAQDTTAHANFDRLAYTNRSRIASSRNSGDHLDERPIPLTPVSRHKHRVSRRQRNRVNPIG